MTRPALLRCLLFLSFPACMCHHHIGALPDAGHLLVMFQVGDSGTVDGEPIDGGDAGADAGGFDAGCQDESAAALCTSYDAQCGALTAADNCGLTQTVQCGDCPDGSICGAIEPNICPCIPESNDEFCNGVQCGALTAPDNCGVTRTVDCDGGCESGLTCGAMEPNVCACEPESDGKICMMAHAVCGSLTTADNCGRERTVNCGVCPTGTCGATAPNTCPCSPDSDDKLCQEYELVTPHTKCEPFMVTDNCGNLRTVLCECCLDAGDETGLPCIPSPIPDAGDGCCPPWYCAGQGCGTPGTCQVVPSMETCGPPTSPVCACNGMTYGNECDAEASGTRVNAQGACPGPNDGGYICQGGECDAGSGCAGLCGSGETCCETTDICYPTECLDCCMQ